MKKICFVVQRYGLDVNGGAELHCRLVAEKLASNFEVDVLTTCAIDHYSWANYYKEGVETINGVKVIRFKTDHERDIKLFNEHSFFIFNSDHNLQDEEEWLKKQGPYSSKLFEYIKQNKENYQKFIFFTYLYAPTFYGLPLVKEKSIFVPTSHDEPPIHLKIFEKLFCQPKTIFYSTLEEKNFVEKKFNNSHIRNKIVGVGFDIPDFNRERFSAKYGIDNFMLYAGRIEEGKGCKTLFEYFLQFKNETKNNLKLVLLGKSAMEIPKNPNIIHLGFVPDQDKSDAMTLAKMLVNPSVFESLSMSVLESMTCRTPVLVNGGCNVTKEHCIKSNAGLWFDNYNDFKNATNFILENPKISSAMGQNGKNYVLKNYSWDGVINDYINEI